MINYANNILNNNYIEKIENNFCEFFENKIYLPPLYDHISIPLFFAKIKIPSSIKTCKDVYEFIEKYLSLNKQQFLISFFASYSPISWEEYLSIIGRKNITKIINSVIHNNLFYSLMPDTALYTQIIMGNFDVTENIRKYYLEENYNFILPKNYRSFKNLFFQMENIGEYVSISPSHFISFFYKAENKGLIGSFYAYYHLSYLRDVIDIITNENGEYLADLAKATFNAIKLLIDEKFLDFQLNNNPLYLLYLYENLFGGDVYKITKIFTHLSQNKSLKSDFWTEYFSVIINLISLFINFQVIPPSFFFTIEKNCSNASYIFYEISRKLYPNKKNFPHNSKELMNLILSFYIKEEIKEMFEV